MNVSKILLLTTIIIGLLSYNNTIYAQQRPINMEDHDSKPYYFGLTFGYNSSAYRLEHTANFATNDTFKNIQSKWGDGLAIGLMGSLKLSDFIDFRFVPTLVFSNKPIIITTYTETETKPIESIYMHLPFQLKFKSDRIQNFRFYGIAGTKVDYDMSANARSRRPDEFLKVKPIDVGAEFGMGFEFYFPNFILAPEIKVSQGLMNTHFKDTELPLSNQLDRITTRMIMFSLHIQS